MCAAKKTVLFSFFVSLLTLSVVFADDTEIFFSQAELDSDTNPNIIFILDNSVSMKDEGPDGIVKLDAMKNAMYDILDESKDIHLGIVNFRQSIHPTEARLVYPVVSINDADEKQAMKDFTSTIKGNSGTPLVGALYEAAMVLLGGSVELTSAKYPSPMTSECQRNHIVLLSDGFANGNGTIAESEALIGQTCRVRGRKDGSETCGVELAQWLNDTDHLPASAKRNNITVSTIGFNIRDNFLKEIAAAGGGQYYEADGSDTLVDAFREIIKLVSELETTFVSPATSINQFNRFTQSNDLFFSMFKPASTATWSGNLKRYSLGDSGGEVVIHDVNGTEAVDPITGLFKDNSQSYWSDIVDGNFVALGGAAGELVSGDRLIYTHIGAIPGSGVTLANQLTASDPGVAAQLSHLSSAEQANLIDWIYGVDIKNENSSSNERKHIGSVLHSTPTTVNYSSGESVVYVGTNEGFLHAIDKNNGKEIYSFIPQELISSLDEFYTDNGADGRPYGLDGDISLLHTDTNGNSVVDDADKAYLYVGMRRGGDDYYAFDITSPDNPRLMWRLDGGNGDFARLGQSWSKPVPTKIQYNGDARDVLIFGGGYDTNQDPDDSGNSNAKDNVGNTLFIVDALTGRRIWSAYENISGISNEMRYSIPSSLRIIDVDGDTFADRIYAGDMGGQVWRFDFKPYHQATDGLGELVDGGVMADLDSGGNRIRFYNEPDVALASHEGKQYMSISIGSGWRAHPLDDAINDRFYMIRDNNPSSKPEGYGKHNGGVWKPIKESDLTDVTDSLAADRTDTTNSDGWMIRLTTTGEKNLSRSITINNQVVFTTYATVASSDICSPSPGVGFIYALDLHSGDPVLPLASDESEPLATADRKKQLAIESIPPAPSAAIVEVGGEIRTSVIVGTETPLNDLPFSNLTQRIYWQDRGRGGSTPATCRAGDTALCR